MNESSLLQAFQGANSKVPVWIMRQAGRYLPQYQQIRKQHKLLDMFQTPEIAAEITLQPIDYLGVSGAILFADILTLPMAMGFDIDFIDGKGPVIENPISSLSNNDQITDFDELPYLQKTIELINNQLSEDIPLIGFAGSPFTVLNYLYTPKTSPIAMPLVQLAYSDPDTYHYWMTKLTSNTIAYLRYQKESGVKAFQLFDTWGGVLRDEDFKWMVLPYVQEIFKQVDLPSIYYVKNSAHLIHLMKESGADMLSVCEKVSLGDDCLRNLSQGIQGNLYNGLLYAPMKTILQEAEKVLTLAKTYHSKYIFNLSHGLLPDFDHGKVKELVSFVNHFSWE